MTRPAPKKKAAKKPAKKAAPRKKAPAAKKAPPKKAGPKKPAKPPRPPAKLQAELAAIGKKKAAAKKKAPPRKRGRKTVKTAANRKIIGDLIALGYSNKTAAEAIPINESTFYDWVDKDPEFSKYIKRRRSEAHVEYATALKEAAGAGSIPAIIFWLKTRTTEFRENVPFQDDTPSTPVRVRTHVIAPDAAS